MKIIKILLMAPLLSISSSCGHKRFVADSTTSGIDTTNLDTNVKPSEDFYLYACGGWIKKHPLAAEYSRYGSFDALGEENRERIKNLIADIASKEHPQGSIDQKIGTLYNLAMDSIKLNKEGDEPIKDELGKLGDPNQWGNKYAVLANLEKEGIDAYFITYIGADEKNSNQNAVQIVQGGLSMGQKDYYVEDDTETVKIRKAFEAHVKKMFELAGFSSEKATQAQRIVMNVETSLAKAFRSQTELRDPQANYNKMTIEELKKLVPTVDWNIYFQTLGLKDVKEVIIGQPNSLKESARLLQTLPEDQLALYFQWKLIDSAAPYLSDTFAQANFEFYGKTMSGMQAMRPRWKRAVGVVSSDLGEAVGQMYVKKYFPPEAKERMEKLVKNLQNVLSKRIDNLTWMSKITKEKAQEKLKAFHVKIGYPNKWKDYSKLDIINDSYWANVKRANEWSMQEMLSKYGKPVDKDEWHMTPQTVNAYYNPTTNEICFPAGILQYPFFDMNADDAFNYGAIGVVIGHEMTHGFDDQGRQYDKEGNLKDWWTPEDTKHFKERAKVMVDFFNGIEVAPGVHGNGELTLGENIADNGGLEIAYQAFKEATKENPLPTVDGLTADQRFFLAYANVWANNIRKEEILKRTKSDPHSLGRWRVNGQLPHLDSWYKAFNISKDSPMYIPVEKRVSIW